MLGSKKRREENLLCYGRRRRLRKRAGFGGSEASCVFAAPLVLFLPEDDIQALREQTVKENLEWNQKEYTVERPNNVERLLEDALRCDQCLLMFLHVLVSLKEKTINHHQSRNELPNL